MKREDIDKAASDYAEENSWYPGETSYESDIIAIEESFADAFKAGAEWRINSVWHDFQAELPRNGELILIVAEINGSSVYFVSIWANYDDGTTEHMKRWAYIEDLIPNTEE